MAAPTRSTMSPPAPPNSRVAWVLAVALPVFVVSARAVTAPWSHPWSHLWVPAALAVGFEVRRLLHRYPHHAAGAAHWHLYFLAAGGVATVAAVATVLSRRPGGDLDPIGIAAVAVGGWLIVADELAHLRDAGRPGK